MRVSHKAEYACIAMLELAANYNEGQPVRLKTIADAHGIPQPFLVHVLLQLKKVGLVVSVRGALGGYQLARPPEEISLADIINVFDPPSQEKPAALHSPYSTALQGVWKELQNEEQRLLEESTLAELLRRNEPTNLSSYQI